MKWRGGRRSSNVDDRRGMSTKGKALLGGGFLGIIILLLQIFGGDTGRTLAPVLQQINQQQVQVNTNNKSRELTAEEKELGEFVSTVLAYTEDVWTNLFQKYNLGTYEKPIMVLFSGRTRSGCGLASSGSGPFYCPADHKLYLDLDFFKELQSRFGAKGGDFAIAYVIAHEIGHHVQTLLGTTQQVNQLQRSRGRAVANKLSVALELQADFYSGVWAHYMKGVLEPGDIEEALDAARAVGDDAIQKRTQGYVIPDSFTHGSSKKRMQWFMKGYQTGDLNQGDTFSKEL